MANTFVVSRSHLVYGVCLPLAVLIGYLLADVDSGSLAVVTLVLCVLSIPLLMRLHHPLLIFSCNAWMVVYFLPGHPQLWMLLTFISLFFSVLNRSIGRQLHFFKAKGVSYSLLCLGIVVLGTAVLTGGIGFNFLGGSNFGGKKYVYLFSGIMLYFALSALSIPRNRAFMYVGLFFLSALTTLVAYLGALGGSGFYFLAELFPMQNAVDSVGMASASASNIMGSDMNRLADLAEVAKGLLFYLMARFGARGMLDIRRPWRMAIFLAAIAASLYSGFRSSVVLFPLTFGLMFCLEGLLRTRYFFIVIASGLIVATAVIPNVNRFPLSMQRALSFVPFINIDTIAREDARGSTEWRLEMWRQLIPEIPRYLIKGKGYSLDPGEVFMVNDAVKRGTASTYEAALVSGDYHSGPLSLIIPFGLFGVAAFFWFLGASVRALYRNYLYGDPYLRSINTLFLAYFIIQIFSFFFVFGSLFSDMMVFCGIVGMSVSLNNGVAGPRPELSLPELEEEEE